jgi:lipopolysaccharide biosynthesis glycosyltransferase
LNIVFATDRGYLQHLAVALASLLEKNNGMNIYVINDDISAADWKKLQKLFAGKDSNLIDAKIDTSQIDNLIINSHVTKATYYRFFMPDLIKENKALYLDVDIVVNQQIDDLYNTEISDTFLAAVDNMDKYNHHELEMASSAKYFNAGVMLINLKYWRACNVKEKVIEFVDRKAELLPFIDQDGLNSIVNGNWLELHPRYNMHNGILYSKYSVDTKIKEAIDNPVIIHYTGASKPWHFGNNHPHKNLYWKYLRKTPYRFALPAKPLNILNMNILRRMIPKPIKDGLKKILWRKI